MNEPQSPSREEREGAEKVREGLQEGHRPAREGDTIEVKVEGDAEVEVERGDG